MINIPNIFRPTPSRKALKKNLPGQATVTRTQDTDGVGEYQSVDRRQSRDRRKEEHKSSIDTRQRGRRDGDDKPHIDVNA